MKKKIWKIILIASFLPAVLILIHSIISFFTGATFMWNTSYGWDALWLALMMDVIIFCTIIPILPACILYQLGHLIVYLIRNKPVIFKRIVVGVLVFVVVVLVGGILVHFYSYEIRHFVEGRQARSMIRRAEEQVEYEKNEFHSDGIFGMEDVIHNRVLVDYDKLQVGFIVAAGIEDFYRIDLSEDVKKVWEGLAEDWYTLQAVIPLSEPGAELRTYAGEEDGMHMTKFLLLKMADGSVYYANDIWDDEDGRLGIYTGLWGSEYMVHSE